MNDPNNQSNFMLNLDRTINFKDNRTFQDLILNKKFDMTDSQINLNSLKLENQFILHSNNNSDEEYEFSIKNKNEEEVK